MRRTAAASETDGARVGASEVRSIAVPRAALATRARAKRDHAMAHAGIERGFPHNDQVGVDAIYGGLQPSPRKLLKRAVMQCRMQISQLDGGITAIARVLANGGHPDAIPDDLRTMIVANMQATINVKQSYERGLQPMFEALV